MSLESYYPPRRMDDEQFGDVNREGVQRALFTPHTGYMDDPQLAARNLKDAAERAGARFHWGKRVTGMSYNSSKTAVTGVVLDDGTSVEAPLVLNASGPHSSILHKIAFSGADIQDD